MAHAWRRRSIAVAVFALLALVTELVGRSLTIRIDRSLSVEPLATPTTPYYPFLLAGVKVVGALAAAALAWRLVRAHATAAAAEQLVSAIEHRRPGFRPRLRLRLSPRLWAISFVSTSLWFLAQNDSQRLSHGRWPLLAPWLHTYALPVFAVLAIVLAIGWAAVRDWLADVEHYAAAVFARAHEILRPAALPRRARPADDRAPRRLFGLAFESRPPPLPPDPRRAPARGSSRRSTCGGEVETQIVTRVPRLRAYRSTRARMISLLGPATALGGLAWAFVQPYRLTLLHPRGQGFWWLVIEPPLLVVAAGLAFALVVARPLIADLEEHRAAP